MDDETAEERFDPHLLLLLTSVFGTGHDATLELTVVVDGTLISGSVVSGRSWSQRQNDQVRIGSPAVASALDSSESTGDDPASPSAEQRYIHFLAPMLLCGGVRVQLPATRVDLRKVAAWSIGRIPGD